MEQWRQDRLIDILDTLIDYRGKTPNKVDCGIPLITAKIVKNGRIDTPTEFLPTEDYNGWMVRGFPQVGDVVLTTEAPLGEVAQLTDEKIALAQRIVCLRGKEGVLDNTYLKYFFLSNIGQNRLKARETGTTVTGIKQSELKEILIDYPKIDTQKAIASVLSSLDSKIELNRRINDNLEQQAQALFKAWFVDFEPFRGGKFVDSELGMIPEGWNIQSISSIFNFQEGPGIRNWQYVNNGTKFINIRCINNDIINIQNANMISDEEAQGKYAHFMLKENDIVISCSGTLGRKALVLKEYLPLCLNTSVIRFTPRINRQLGFLYGYLGSSLFLNKQIELASGSVQANFGPIHLKGMSIAIPDNNVLNQFSDIVNSIIQKKKNIISESLRLTNLRDSILPKLMSGKIKIDKLNS
ncbi:restriction endonuclease subunit S [Bacteroides acidifaciens]|uniref:restriction endonuclease subunit S n=2 Tax=Bacteroides acidifaciens TaxID=85831 RepID=UPI00272C108F|nr:restriction endonuclease subunit S [Bacteroides acidifaciens]